MAKQNTSVKTGLIQAIGVGVYIALVGLFMRNANSIFPKIDNFLGPILFLLLFSSSALLCGLIVFYKPYKLFFSGKKEEAAKTVLSTAFWLFAILIIFFLGMLLFR